MKGALFFIFVVISSTAYSLMLVKRNKIKEAATFDKRMAQIVLILYVALNIWFISQTSSA